MAKKKSAKASSKAIKIQESESHAESRTQREKEGHQLTGGSFR
jgi:hypothetical protein